MEHLTDEDKVYIEQMESWFREQEAREKQIKATIETSQTIVNENKLQLEWHEQRMSIAKKDFAEWLEGRAKNENS